MARFKSSGLDDIIQQMVDMGETVGELADEMLYAGAEEVAEAWKISIRRNKHVKTGDLYNSVGFPRKVRKIGDIKLIDIYPLGKDRNGVRNAEKAFILHYGTSKIKASTFVDEADDLAGPMVEKRLQEIFDDWMMSKEV